MSTLDLPRRVAAIETTITNALASLGDIGMALRGKSALWVLEFPSRPVAVEVGERLLAGGVIASMTGLLRSTAAGGDHHRRESAQGLRGASGRVPMRVRWLKPARLPE